jgi:2-polyprenyl-3-methyl-5-hydroxy-6-metoxy-1,4-benzoquinol methylase
MKLSIPSTFGWESQAPEQSHSYLVPICLKILKANNCSSLLDVGTGNGATIPIWLSHGIKVSAIEPDSVGFAYAKRNLEADVKQLGVGDNLPSDWKARFDALICLEVIEHLFNPNHLVEAALYALKDDGILIVSTPYHGYLKNLALSFTNKWDFHHNPMKVGGHVKFWSKSTITRFFAKYGFELFQFIGAGRVPYFWKSMIVVFRKKAFISSL